MHQAAAVFEGYHLDFCCKGKRTLQQACDENNISVEPVVAELLQVAESESAIHDHMLAAMTAEQLVDYIILKHHFYVRQAMPVIFHRVQKVAMKHGDRFPYMQQVFQLFATSRNWIVICKKKRKCYSRVLRKWRKPCKISSSLLGPLSVM